MPRRSSGIRGPSSPPRKTRGSDLPLTGRIAQALLLTCIQRMALTQILHNRPLAMQRLFGVTPMLPLIMMLFGGSRYQWQPATDIRTPDLVSTLLVDSAR
jgi:hypothetical protein